MEILRGIDARREEPGPTVAIVGKFSVVHLGHRVLFDRMREAGSDLRAALAVVTFDRHPLETLAPDRAPDCVLASLDQRLAQLEEVGTDVVLVLAFTRELAALEPEEFVDRTLVQALHAKRVVVGEDHRFGHKHRGDVALLRELGTSRGFEVDAVPLVQSGADAISTTAIRDHVAAGRVQEAARLMGRNYRLEGTVVVGAKRGKTIGFPTINLEPTERVCVPALGVYAGWWRHDGRRLPGVINFGMRPTFADTLAPKMEMHVFDFDEDLYGRRGEIEFEHHIRDERKFDGPAALIEQIGRDVARARELLHA